jgi:putative transposase
MKKITITKTQQTLLLTITNASTSPQRLVRRANLILTGFTTGNQFATAKQTGYARDTVHKWFLRWQSAYDELGQLESDYTAGHLSEFKYTRALTAILDDAPRPGHPPTFSEAQKQRIIAMASEKPEKEGVPIDAWTHATLQIAAIDKGIVPTISVAHVGRFLKEGHTTTTQK